MGLNVPPVRTSETGIVGPHGQRQVQGLKHQSGRARRADVDGEVARNIVFGREGQLASTDGRAGDLRLPNRGGCLDGLQMLRAQARAWTGWP